MRSQAQRNKDVILAEATRMFLARGYEVQLHEIARAAGVRRQTIYNLFGSKFALLETVALHLASQTAADALSFKKEADIRRGLLKLAFSYYDVMLDPRSLQLHRLLTAEAPREPELAQTIYNRTAGPLHASLAAYLRTQTEKGAIVVDDAALAAEQFLGLIVGPLHLQVTYSLPPARSRRAQCHAAVETFMRAYGAAARAADEEGGAPAGAGP